MTPSNEERRKEIERIFQDALDVPAAERDALLRERCGDDEALRREVETLIVHYESAQGSSPLDQEALRRIHERAGDESTFVAGKLVGPYKLIRQIGEGGMGRVFLASREDLPKRVAIKLAREPLASEERTRRFKLEQWVLAGLEHPGIAQLYDAGVTDDGTPYFAMEYVEGEPIDVYCDRKRLPVEGRLQLMLKVMAAVEHSHAHLVIHRDIKPSNIVVNEAGETKLLDFGIAKLLTDDLETQVTRSGLVAMSPAYAAPEQFTRDPVSTATDVYQLGAVLYELLAGKPPLDTVGKSFAEVLLEVSKTEPPPVSTHVTAEVAAMRGATPDQFRRKLRGDLDHVLAKALEKEPERRYASVGAMAEDIRRYLAHEPLEARAATPIERAQKFMMRHKIGVGIAAVLLVYAVTATYALVQIGAERDRARREAAAARSISDFLVSVFYVADPADTTTGNPTAVQIVDRSVEQVETDLADQPAMQASMQEVLGRVYHQLGRDDQAEKLLRQSLATREELFADDAVEIADSRHWLSQVLWTKGDLATADSLTLMSLDVRKRAYGETSEEYWSGLSDLATIKQALGDLDEAERLLRELVRVVRETHPEGYLWIGPWLNNLANIYMDQGRHAEAEQMMREALESDREVLQEPHPWIALRLSNLSSMAARAGRYEESLELGEQALWGYTELHDGPHPDIPYALTNVGNASRELGDMARADSCHRAALEMREGLFEPGHPGLVVGYRAMGEHMFKSGRSQGALPYIERWNELAEQVYGNEHFLYATSLWWLGRAHEELGRTDEAQAELQQAYELHLAAHGPDHPQVVEEREHLAELATP